MSAILHSLDAQSRVLANLAGPTMGLDLPGVGGPASTVGVGRGAAALEQWRSLLSSRPEVISQRIRANRDQALMGGTGAVEATTSCRSYLASEVPFGNTRTAAFLMFGIADVLDMMERGHWHMAEAHGLLLLAAGEQAAMQSWQWSLAWLLTQMPEPPWGRICQQPKPDAIRPLSRLADQALMTAAVAYYTDVHKVAEVQKKASSTTTPQRGGDGGQPQGEDAPAKPTRAPRRGRGGPKGAPPEAGEK